MKALIFDCDGVLVDTERDGHRAAFNQAFALQGLNIQWSVELYADLLKVAGGKERMRHYFDTHQWPPGVEDRDQFIKNLHRDKTELFMRIIESGQLPVRPGVKRLIDEAIAAGMKLAVCSTSNEKAVRAVVHHLLGEEREAKFDAILAGDVVSRKKPDPEIYNLAKERLGLAGEECVVVEDSRNGLMAAHSAGMNCIVTTSTYTTGEDFHEADKVVPELGDDPVMITLSDLQNIVTSKIS